MDMDIIEIEPEEDKRSGTEKELLVDLVREQIRKPSNLDRSEPKIAWPEVQRKFNSSWICSHEASRYELSKMWRTLKNSPRAKMDDVDHVPLFATSPKTSKTSKSPFRKSSKGSSRAALKKSKKASPRSPLTPVRQNRQALYMNVSQYEYQPNFGVLSTPSYQPEEPVIEVPSSPESVKASTSKKPYFSLRGFEC